MNPKLWALAAVWLPVIIAALNSSYHLLLTVTTLSVASIGVITLWMAYDMFGLFIVPILLALFFVYLFGLDNRRMDRIALAPNDVRIGHDYRTYPGSELRFNSFAEEDWYYDQLYKNHGGCKIWAP